MGVERVYATDDPRVALYQVVGDPELAKAHGLFVAEGRLVVRRVLEEPRYRVRSMLLNDAAHRDLAPLLTRIGPSFSVLLCETEEFEGITGYNIHRGCLALVERPPRRSVAEVIAGARTLVLVDGVGNADNVGGIFRNAAAFGVDAVVLSPDSCDPLYRKAIRTSMGAALRVPFAHSVAWHDDLAAMRGIFTMVALTPRESSVTLDSFAEQPRPARLALVVGAEGRGVSSFIESVADACVRIQIANDIDSLNVAVATGIALHRLRAHS